MDLLQAILMVAFVSCLHRVSCFDHRFRDELTLSVPKRPVGECLPGTSSDDGCNVCTCGSKGMWMCTMRHCERSLPWLRNPWSRSKDVPVVENIPGSPSLVREKRSPISIGSTTVLIRNADKCPTRGDIGTIFQDGCKACRCVAPNLAGCNIELCRADVTTTTVAPTEEDEHTTTPTPTQTTTAMTASTTTTAPWPEERVIPIPASAFCKTLMDIGLRYFDGCNRCRCYGIGRAGCGRRACPVIRRVTPTPASEVCLTEQDNGKRYFDGCNWCRCFSVGNAACTYRACPVIRPTTKPKDSSVPMSISEACRASDDIGKRFFDGCNRCRCTRIGRAACTTKTCRKTDKARPTESTTMNTPATMTTVKRSVRRRVRPTPASEVCKTRNDFGKSYYDGCNWCHCLGIGRAGCTRRMCPFVKEKDPAENTSTTAEPTTPRPREFCTVWTDAGRRYFDGCNHCLCSRRLRKICTQRYCLTKSKE